MKLFSAFTQRSLRLGGNGFGRFSTAETQRTLSKRREFLVSHGEHGDCTEKNPIEAGMVFNEITGTSLQLLVENGSYDEFWTDQMMAAAYVAPQEMR